MKWYVIARQATTIDGEDYTYPLLIYSEKERAQLAMKGANTPKDKVVLMEVMPVKPAAKKVTYLPGQLEFDWTI